jgi:uncharacterized protein
VNVTVVWATARVQDAVPVELPPGATVADAVAASGLLAQHDLDPGELGFAIFGRRARGDAQLAEGDRVELTGPLLVDPKVARARRARAKSPPSV